MVVPRTPVLAAFFVSALVVRAMAAQPPEVGLLVVERDLAYPNDRPVYELNLALAALRAGERSLAEAAFEAALGSMNSRPDNEDATAELDESQPEERGGRRARRRARREAEQSAEFEMFAGDPYERVMAHFYRGILHIRAEEFAKATEVFDSGAEHDQFGRDVESHGDFYLMALLASWSSYLGSDPPWQRRIEEFNQETKSEVSFEAGRCLVLAESGSGPRKLRDGVGGFRRVYRRGKEIPSDQVVLKGSSGFIAHPDYVEDVYWQARTRGAHEVKSITEEGIHFVNPQSVAQELGVEVRRLDASRRAAAGFVLTFEDLAAFRRSERKPPMDVRTWNNLPDRVSAFLIPCEVATDGRLEARFLGSTGEDLGVGLPVRFDSTARTAIVGRDVDTSH